MSAAAAAAAAPASPGKSKKKLVMMIAIAAVVLVGGGVGGLVYMKKQQAAHAAATEEEGVGEEPHAPAAKKAHKKDEHKTPPIFVPMDPFVVNLADREVERYAQIGVTLEVPDTHVGDEIKSYLPAIRNNILMLIAHKSSADLAGPEGKELLAREIRREALRAMGEEVEENVAVESGNKKKKKHADDDAPIRTVQFSSFIIQ